MIEPALGRRLAEPIIDIITRLKQFYVSCVLLALMQIAMQINLFIDFGQSLERFFSMLLVSCTEYIRIVNMPSKSCVMIYFLFF